MAEDTIETVSDSRPLTRGQWRTLQDVILDSLKSVADKAEARSAALEARITALEARRSGGAQYCGIHEAGRLYAEGSLVTRSGGLWIATWATGQTPGGPDSGWKLIVKSGRVE